MRTKLLAVVAVISAMTVGFGASAAFAVDPDPVTSATGLVTDGVSALGPVIVAVAGAGLALLVLTTGLRLAYGVIKSRGQRVGV
jgi:hypothetical protein